MFKFRSSVSVTVRDEFRIWVRLMSKYSIRVSIGLGLKLGIVLGLWLLLLVRGRLEISLWCGFKL